MGGDPFDYHLTFGSPCIDAGTEVGLPFSGLAPDLGAFESDYSGVDDSGALTAGRFELYQNYPNPFNASTVISYKLQAASWVELKVYDITGREIQSLVNGYRSLGQHSVVWDAEGFSSGVYFLRLEALPGAGTRPHSFRQTRKLLLLK